jgi:hypothetical protein
MLPKPNSVRDVHGAPLGVAEPGGVEDFQGVHALAAGRLRSLAGTARANCS